MKHAAARAMLSRYRIVRGQPLAGYPARIRAGARVDVRAHRGAALSPPQALVDGYLAAGTAAAWRDFERAYRAVLEERFVKDRAPFDELARRAAAGDVYLGCNCPTARNPDPHRCHTVLALRFLARRYPRLDVELRTPGPTG